MRVEKTRFVKWSIKRPPVVVKRDLKKAMQTMELRVCERLLDAEQIMTAAKASVLTTNANSSVELIKIVLQENVAFIICVCCLVLETSSAQLVRLVLVDTVSLDVEIIRNVPKERLA